ncbi:MAG: hypothetical protein M3N98_11010, partial [Actinomycetota bacterium]|nr:hypothetical protein [Actinomycetota bacterium]
PSQRPPGLRVPQPRPPPTPKDLTRGGVAQAIEIRAGVNGCGLIITIRTAYGDRAVERVSRPASVSKPRS